jgi:hypothetical protein
MLSPAQQADRRATPVQVQAAVVAAVSAATSQLHRPAEMERLTAAAAVVLAVLGTNSGSAGTGASGLSSSPIRRQVGGGDTGPGRQLLLQTEFSITLSTIQSQPTQRQ